MEFIQLDINPWTETGAEFHLPKVLGHARAARPSGVSASSSGACLIPNLRQRRSFWAQSAHVGSREHWEEAQIHTALCPHSSPIHPGKSRSPGLPPARFSAPHPRRPQAGEMCWRENRWHLFQGLSRWDSHPPSQDPTPKITPNPIMEQWQVGLPPPEVWT